MVGSSKKSTGGRATRAAPHTSRIGPSGPIGGVRQLEPIQKLVGPGHDEIPRHLRDLADQPEVLATRQQGVDRCELPGHADAEPNLLRVPHDVKAQHLGPAAVRPKDRGEDADRGGLARTVRSEQPEHGAALDLEIYAGERLDAPEAFGQVLDDDRGLAGHRSTLLCRSRSRHPPTDT